MRGIPSADDYDMFWWACVGSWPHVWLINWVTQTEGENAAKGADKDRDKKGEGALPLMHAYSLPVWLWRTVTLFAWLVEPLGHDWPCYIIPPTPLFFFFFLSSLIYQDNSPKLVPFLFLFQHWKWSIYLAAYTIAFSILCQSVLCFIH